jgi:hypothetical protein
MGAVPILDQNRRRRPHVAEAAGRGASLLAEGLDSGPLELLVSDDARVRPPGERLPLRCRRSQATPVLKRRLSPLHLQHTCDALPP